MDELQSEFLLTMTVTAAQPHHSIGDSGRGARAIATITGGSFEGPHLRGEVLPVGGDFYVRRSDGVAELDVRAILKTDDGAEIYTYYPGVAHQHSLGPLGDLPEGETYFRTTLRFETGDERYQWLTRIIAVGVRQPQAEPGTVSYRVYAIL